MREDFGTTHPSDTAVGRSAQRRVMRRLPPAFLPVGSVIRVAAAARRRLAFASLVALVIGLGFVITGDFAAERSSAANVVDGKVDPGEYAFTRQITSPSPCSASNPCGTIHFTFGPGAIYVAFEYEALNVGPNGVVGGGDDPVINENVFGPKSYHSTFSTGWNNHNFGHLLHSDALRSQIFCSQTGQFNFSSPTFDWAQDYLEAGGPGGWHSPSGTNPGDAGSPAAPAPGPVPAGIVSASSLEWNLENSTFDITITQGSSNQKNWRSPNFNPKYPVPAAEAGDFVWEMIYEFSFPRSSLPANCNFIALGFPAAHNSPAKGPFPDTIVVPPTSSIEVCKDVVPDDGGASSWSFTLSGPTPGSVSGVTDGACHTFTDRAGGTYTLTEIAQPGYTTTVDCGNKGSDSDNDITFVLGSSETVRCTFTNTQAQGGITVCKDVVPDDGGASSWDFTLSGPTPGSAVDLTDGRCHTFEGRSAGEYTLTETAEDGYTTSVECDNGKGSDTDNDITFTLAAGESVTCTFTNTSQASIRVCKEVVPDDNGATTWDFDLSGPTPGSAAGLRDGECFTFGNRTPGSYTLTETSQSPEYDTTVACDSGNGSDDDNDITFTLNAGEEVTCTFTNRAEVTIIVCKDVVPDDFGVTTWDFDLFDAAGAPAGSISGLVDDECDESTFANILAGTYTLEEMTQAGYETEVDCGNFGSDSGASIELTLDAGDVVTCTFTNTQLSSIKIIKETDPEGAVTDFLFISTLGNFTLTGDGDSEFFGDLLPGDYDFTEVVPADWKLEFISCNTSGTSSMTDGVTIHLGPGEGVECTFSNTKLGSITIVKETDPDTDTSTEFPFTSDLGAFTLVGHGDSQFFGDLEPGDYAFSEVVPSPDWALTSISCEGADFTPDNPNLTVHLDAGEDAVCTFFNQEQATITIVKETDPDTDTTTEFPFTGSFTFSLIGHGDSEVFGPLTPDAIYNFVENVPEGWRLIEIDCQGTALFIVIEGGKGVAIEPDAGEDVVCTFTNQELGSITVCKDVVPDDGGLTEWRFDLFVGDVLQDFVTLTGGQCHTFDNLPPGAYEIVESGGNGYTTEVDCGNKGSDTDRDIEFELGPGEDLTCRFTNTSQAGITVCKEVVPDDNGATTWDFDLSGPTPGSAAGLRDGECFTFGNRTPGSYTLTETSQSPEYDTTVACDSGNGSDDDNDITFTLNAGEEVRCTFTNTELVDITVCKDVEPDDDGATQWTVGIKDEATHALLDSTVLIDIDAANGECHTFENLDPVSYIVFEETREGYTPEVECEPTGETRADYVVLDTRPGDDITCTFINTSTAFITVCKDVDPDDNGATTWDVILTDAAGTEIDRAVGLTDIDSTGREVGCHIFGPLVPDVVYTLTEITQDGYATSVECDNGAFDLDDDVSFLLNPGDQVLCAFLNERLGTVEVCKELLPESDTSLWDIRLGSNGRTAEDLGDGDCHTFENVEFEAYLVSEGLLSGYVNLEVDCGDEGGTSDGSGSAGIDVDPGDRIICTFLNARLGSITVCKNVEPDDNGLTPWDFELFDAAGALVGTAEDLIDGACHTFSLLVADTYTLVEETQEGYTTAFSCGTGKGSGRGDTASIALDWGEDVTCTFVNTSEASITVCKDVVPDDNGATDWDFSLSGPTPGIVFGLQDDGVNNCFSFLNRTPGDYTLTEVDPDSGYFTEWDCPGHGSGEGETTDVLVLEAGESITCFFTNTLFSTITVCKDVVPDDDGVSTWDFVLRDSSESVVGTADDLVDYLIADIDNFEECHTFEELLPDVYGLTEATDPSYDVDFECDGNVLGNLTSGHVRIELGPGEDVTCVFTNFLLGTITVCKNVEPDDASTWDFNLSGPDPDSVGGLIDIDSGGRCHTFEDLSQGLYTLTEATQAGYNTSVECDNNTSSATANIDIDLGPGEHVTCTFLNQWSSITVCKDVEPDHASQWQFGLNGPQVDDETSDLLGDGECFTYGPLIAGSYTLDELQQNEGYDTSVSCDNGASAAGVSISFTLGVNEHVTCTFLNLQLGDITIIKETDPDGAPDSFSFTGDLGNFSLTDGGSHSVSDLLPGVYTVTEQVPAGWQLLDIDCGEATVSGVPDGVTITLEAGESVTCTFNNRARGSITIVKQTLPAGASDPFTFTGSLGGFTLNGDGDSQTFADLVPGSYSFSENVPEGWLLDGISCSGGSATISESSVSVDLGPGEAVVCTYTNVELGTIIVVKQTDPDGSEQPFDFGGSLGSFALVDGGSITFTGLTPGSYSVSELVPEGWELGSVECVGGPSSSIAGGVTVDLPAGGSVTCTFNNEQLGSVTIVKETVPSTDTSTAFSFGGSFGAFTLVGNGASQTFSGLSAGTYNVSEVVPDDWFLTGVECSGAPTSTIADGVSIDLPAGGSATCVFTNATNGAITIVKETVPQGSPQIFDFIGDLGSFQLSDGQSFTADDLPPGSYLVSEVLEDGWTLFDIQCSKPNLQNSVTEDAIGMVITLEAGQEVVCTFINVEEGEPTPTPPPATPTPSPTTPTPTPTPRPTPTPSPTPSPTPTPSPSPTASPTPSPTPLGEQETPEPTPSPTPSPTALPVVFPPTGGGLAAGSAQSALVILLLAGVAALVGGGAMLAAATRTGEE